MISLELAQQLYSAGLPQAPGTDTIAGAVSVPSLWGMLEICRKDRPGFVIHVSDKGYIVTQHPFLIELEETYDALDEALARFYITTKIL